jgi:hypothetical protein
VLGLGFDWQAGSGMVVLWVFGSRSWDFSRCVSFVLVFFFFFNGSDWLCLGVFGWLGILVSVGNGWLGNMDFVVKMLESRALVAHG